jgi:hypothetical protein
MIHRLELVLACYEGGGGLILIGKLPNDMRVDDCTSTSTCRVGT